MNTFNIEWRSQEGYGDFITGLCYAHSSTIKYERPVKINFHWPNPKDFLLSNIDKESILYRFNYIKDLLRPVTNLTITHTYSSSPSYRFINELEEFNPVHGLWYPKQKPVVEPGLVVYWSSRHNLEFPGYHKDPVYDYWDKVVANLKQLQYNVQEVTYRTPVTEVMNLIHRCEFGIGYEGMIHQLFKFMWKPLVVASKRVSLSELLCPQACIVTNHKPLMGDITELVKESKKNIRSLLIQHQKYIMDKQDPTTHTLFNIPT